MKVLVINAGSSSLKYQLLDMENEAVMASGIVERIGAENGSLTHKAEKGDGSTEKTELAQEICDHTVGVNLAIDLITDPEKGVIADKSEIDAIGHRVVQGGEDFSEAVRIDDTVKDKIHEISSLAPLHNPANLMGIAVAEHIFPGIPNVAVFDTEFHQTMPEKAFLYPLPYTYYEELKIRKYGFHGTSHKFVARKTAKVMGKNIQELNIITVHLGNGGSVSAVASGKCMDTSMGMTPLAGIMMGTRCGDIDPAITGYIAERKQMTAKEIDFLLNNESGLMGICGKSDMRDIHSSIEAGDQRAKLAVEMFAYRVKKYIGSYYAALGTVDAIAFTAGIGENDDKTRALCCENLTGMGIELDLSKNVGRIGDPKKISQERSRVQVWVIPTNEELQIAHDAVRVVKG